MLVFMLGLSGVVQAKTVKARLSDKDISRLEVVKEILSEVETKPLSSLIQEIEQSAYPQMSLTIKEAMARAYADIIIEQNVVGKAKREWLYSMVALNMAYFQFGGAKDSASGATNLNKLIRYKLKMYLPVHIFQQPGFHCSIG
jgi:alanyl-tRNA synthetase